MGISELKKMEFFKDMTPDIIQTLLNVGSQRQYHKKEVIFNAVMDTESVYVVLKGAVMVYSLTRQGGRKVLFILGKGHLVNHNILSRKPVSVFCEAISPVEMLLIPQKKFVDLFQQNVPLMQAVVMEYERYIWRLSHQLKNTTGSMQTERKIAAKLWKLGRDFGIQKPEGVYIEIEMTMTLLADLVGVPRENVSRACKNLSERGLLIHRNRHFILPNQDRLADFYKM